LLLTRKTSIYNCPMTLIFATRPSALARWQTSWVIQSLQAIFPEIQFEEKIITTQGDRVLDRALPEIGGKGLFTQELEAALLSGEVSAAVHSLKDLPIEQPEGLKLAAIPYRAEVRDAFISATGADLDELPPGAVIGTSSLRRAAQLLARRPDLKVAPIRGNVDTRIRKILDGQYDGGILAGAGLIRLGLDVHITHWLPLDWMLPAPGQGALAVQCRSTDVETVTMLEAIQDRATELATRAERTFLQALGGGCSLPVGAYACLQGDRLVLEAMAASPDGKRFLRTIFEGSDPAALGQQTAQALLERGAGDFIHGS
jgi:hydroxymethylbilane synthase